MEAPRAGLWRGLSVVMVVAFVLTACVPATSTGISPTDVGPGVETLAAPTSVPQPTTAATEALPTTAPTQAEQPTVAPTEAGLATEAPTAEMQETMPPSGAIQPATFRNDMRKLWEDHIMWTRLYIVSFAADLPDTDAVAERLLQNQADIGNAVKPFYGEEAGNQLTTLLEEHITGAVDVLTAAKADDSAALDTANTAWYDNASQIAVFLSGANPDNWPEATLQAEMKMHLDLTLDEASAHLAGDTAADLQAYEKVHDHMLHFSDTLANGIMSQFPEQFAPEDEGAANEWEFSAEMRRLWTDHVFWTRQYIVSFAADLPDTQAVAERLLQNQADIGDAVKPFYGEEAGDQLTALLEEHITGAVDVLTAAKAGDNAGLETANTAWFANADQIAGFLSTANPDNWPLATMQEEMNMHLNVTLDEASAHLAGDTAGSISGYDAVVDHILNFSDTLSDGIIKQFPGDLAGS